MQIGNESADGFETVVCLLWWGSLVGKRVRIFLAAKPRHAKQILDKDEMLSVHKAKVDDAIKMSYKGEIQDGKTIAGLFLASCWLK